LAVVLACVLIVPEWLVRWELGAPARTLTAVERAKAINDVRTTLLQGIGGSVLLLGAYLTYRQLQTGREQLQVAQQGQVTERFTRAIDQLGHAEIDVRLGGIYALERIANDSPDDRATIAEVLTAFVRGHAPWPPRLPGQYVADAPMEKLPELQVRAPDVQAALTVLARRQPPPRPSGPLDLHDSDLRKASLVAANLQGAILAAANLQNAHLSGAQLQEAMLSDAQLQGASLNRAQLQEASLDGADLQGAHLYAANLQEAILSGAQLQGAGLDHAQLQGAILGGANLQGAYLRGAQLQEALLSRADLQEAVLDRAQLQGARLRDARLQGARLRGARLQGANLVGAQLQGANLVGAEFNNARADPGTNWPEGFDPAHAGLMLIDRPAETSDDRES
jgi:uncharacterized protein YjbI with pentapeptide repeats